MTPVPLTGTELDSVRDAVQRRVLSLATAMVHWASHRRPNPDGSKIGGHQAPSASSVGLLPALTVGRAICGARAARAAVDMGAGESGLCVPCARNAGTRMVAAKRPIPWLVAVVMLPLGVTACGDDEDGDAVDACRHVEAIAQPQTVAAESATPDEVRSWASA